MKSCDFRHVYVLLFSGLLAACNSMPGQQTQTGQCPQTRTTEYAPAAIAGQLNPLVNDEKNLDAGEQLYQKAAAPVACAQCHGENGNGNGIMASMFEPAPRNFTCTDVVSILPDGQLFWIIKNGSIGTSMPAFNQLSDKQIWQLTMYIRTLEIKPVALKKIERTSMY